MNELIAALLVVAAAGWVAVGDFQITCYEMDGNRMVDTYTCACPRRAVAG
ncbi:MAG: hypothetical protein HY059_05030 [Proteobacteria bacterium]|nr:hypothetical protein [Pseudomonadota bacterium]